MKLAKAQIAQLHAALLDGYDEESLRVMVRLQLDEVLAAITQGGAFKARVFNLIEWAERNERVFELIDGAHEDLPGNGAIQRVWAAAQGWRQRAEPSPTNTQSALPPPTAQPPAPAAIFLSYSREDTALMEQLKGDLAAQGLRVWTDAGLKPGTENWMQAIDEAIRQAQCLVVILSPAARQSKWVNIEIARAEQRGLRIFPVLARSAGIDAIPIALTTYQYVDIREAYAQKVSQELIPALREHLGLAAPAEPALPPPVQTAPAASPAQPPPAKAAPPVVVAQPPAPPADLLASLGIEWITIPAGKFRMGSDKEKDKLAQDWETPQHTLYLPEFRIAKVPITNAQYRLFVQAAGHRAPGHWKQGNIPQDKGQHPVGNVTWYDTQAFCRWAGVRLPTEAEWEKAARGVGGRIYPWGDAPPDAQRCNFNRNGGDTTPVGAYPLGASPYGVLDMAGNVWEWTSSLYKPYPYRADDGREDPGAAGDRALRGGSFSSFDGSARCAYRYYGYLFGDLNVGLRVVSPSS